MRKDLTLQDNERDARNLWDKLTLKVVILAHHPEKVMGMRWSVYIEDRHGTSVLQYGKSPNAAERHARESYSLEADIARQKRKWGFD